MSTYNGATYVAEQLKSILQQLPPSGRVLIRDDGSTDETVEVIGALKDKRIDVTLGANIGFAKSFFELMRCAPQDADMYMLADQDDVWLPGKVERAWAEVSRAKGCPMLYCSTTRVVDKHLRPLGLSSTMPSGVTFLNALTENMVTGCTVAMNRQLLVLADPKDAVDRIIFHDWWLFVVAIAFGVVHHDQEPSVLYRQHSSNFIGRGVGVFKYFKMLKYLMRRNWLADLVNQIEAIRHRYKYDLTRSQHAILNEIQDPGRRLRRWTILLSKKRFRASLSSEMLFRSLLLLDWRSVEN